MSLIRVRLCIDRGPCFNEEQCWMLVETSSCKFIHDFEYLIRKKFFMDDGHNVILNLYLDDFLLPSQEKIEVIRDNDVIRVKKDKIPTFKEGKLSQLSDENKNENPKKRKFEESNDVKKKRKKMKHSPTKNKKQQDIASAKQSKNPPNSQVASTKTSLKTFDKAKCRKAIDFLQKVTKDNTKKVSGGEISAGNSCQGKRIKHKNKSLKKKFKSSALSCILEKWNPASNIKKSNVPAHEQVGNVALEKESKERLHSLAKPLRIEKGNKESLNAPVKDVQNIPVNAISGPKEVSGSNKSKEKKKPSLIQSSQKSSTSASSATSTSLSSESSSDGETNANMMVKKSTFNGHTVSERNEPQGGEKVQIADQDVNESKLHKQNERHNVCPSKQSTSNHIRFDYDSEPVEKAAKTAPLPSSSNVLPACSASTGNNGINGTPNLSPIQKNNIIENTTPSDNAQKRSATENQGKGRSNNFRKDVYTYKSVVMESTRMEKELPKEDLCPVPTNVPEKDFSKYQPLVGPPRVGETVAYKILELTQSYTPEISRYKVGKVLSFDPALQSMNLKLTKESLTRATGDGHVSLKFELLDGNDDEEDLTVPLEIPDEVEVQWSSMIDPRLIVAGIVQ